MLKKLSILLIVVLILINTSQVMAADKGAGIECTPGQDICIAPGYSCQPSKTKRGAFVCDEISSQSVFGQIQAPDALKELVKTDPTGAAGISKFLSNLVALIYSLAAIVLIFMLIWGAFDWMISEGNKEKIESARNKIINAIIGIILFAIAFGILNVLGYFTGFKFYQKPVTNRGIDKYFKVYNS